MTTIQIVINGNQVEGEASQIAQILGMVSNTLTQQIAPVTNNQPIDLLPFNELVIAELTPQLGDEIAKKVVNLLEHCRSGSWSDFSPFVAAYRWVNGDIEKRQLLKTISAIYRFKFHKGATNYYSLKSEIKYATICPHCGKIANALVQRLVKEGLWK